MGIRDEAPMWDDIPELVELGWFKDKVAELVRLKEQAAQLESQIKDAALEVESGLAVAGCKRVRFGDKYCIEQSGGRSSNRIDARLLAAHGVDAETIAACTQPGKSYTYVQVLNLEKKNE
jgi:hypothetical protein